MRQKDKKRRYIKIPEAVLEEWLFQLGKYRNLYPREFDEIEDVVIIPMEVYLERRREK